jgi:DNA repair exonuclease SbcCD ATPase subunit
MLVRAFDAELRLVTVQLCDEQAKVLELQDRCDSQNMVLRELRAANTSKTRELDGLREILVSQESHAGRQKHQIDYLQSHVDKQKAELDALSSTAKKQAAKVAAQNQEIHDLRVIIESNADAVAVVTADWKRASRDAEHLRAFIRRQRSELVEEFLVRETQFLEARTRLDEQERFIRAQNERLEAQARDLVLARRRIVQLSKKLTSVSRSLQLQEDHAVMIKKDATEIQPKLVELQAAQEELDLQKTQLIAREIKMQGRGQVLEHRHEALDSRRERADFALEQNLGSVAVQVRRLIGTESVHPSQPRCSEELRSNKDGLPSNTAISGRPRVVRVGA